MSERARKSSIVKVLLPAGAVLASAFAGTALGSYQQYAICLALLAALVGVALIMIVGYARIIMLASGAMSAIGAYGASLLVLHFHTPFVAAIAFAGLLGGLAGVVLAIPATRFRGHYLAMVTLVFQMVTTIAIREGGDLTGGSAGLKVPPVGLFGISLQGDTSYLIFTGFATAFAVATVSIMLSGHFGRVLRATSMSEIGVAAFGVHIRMYHIAAFAISSGVIAFGGALLAPRVRILDPESFGFLASVLALAYPIVGGLTSVWGGLLGGVILRLFPEWLRGLHEFQDVVYAALVIATMRFLPGGLIDSLRDRVTQSRRASQTASPTPVTLGLPTAYPTNMSRPVGARFEIALELQGVRKSFGSLCAVDGVDMDVRAGTIHGLIGPNGAGKTSLFNMISGFIPSDAGAIRIFGADLTAAEAPTRIVHGVTRTFQNIAAFGKLTCLENVMIGIGRNNVGYALAMSLFEFVDNAQARERREQALAALEAVGIAQLAATPASLLSLGNQRRLEIARAIVSKPRLILFDEPVSGVSAEEEHRIEELLLRLNRETSVTMLIVEHDIGFIRRLSHDVSVMVHGKVLQSGRPEVVLADPRVRAAYFGEAPVTA